MSDDAGTVQINRMRLSQVLESLEAMAAGKEGIRAPISRQGDELDALAHAANVMAGELRFRFDELRRAQDQLYQSGQLAALGQVSSGLAHELNNPLAIIRGYLEEIRAQLPGKTLSDERLDHFLERIDESVERMGGIIGHVTEFARQSPRPQGELFITEPVSKAVLLLGEQLRLRRVRVILETGAEEVRVRGDMLRLEQVFLNLLTNARDAIPPEREGNIRISWLPTRGHVEVEVADDGDGMSEETRARIFDPFFTTKDLGKGTGLGLSISLGIIREHGGTLSCSSRAGEGTSFLIRLPRSDPK